MLRETIRAALGRSEPREPRITAGPPLLIRPGCERDLHAIAAIQLVAYGYRWMDSVLYHELTRRDSLAFVAVLGPRTVGFALGEAMADCRHVYSLVGVAPAFQRQGIGSALVEAMFPSWPCVNRRVTIRVGERSLPGQLFLRAAGFKCERILRGEDLGVEDVYEFDRSK